MDDDMGEIERQSFRKKKVKKTTYTVPQQSTAEVLRLYSLETKPNIPEINVRVVDHTQPSKFNNIKTLQFLLLWLFTAKAHNPLWITIKNQSKIRHCMVITIEIEQSIFFNLLNSNGMPYIKEIFDVNRKAQYRDSHLSSRFLERLLCSHHVPQKQAIVAKPVIPEQLSTDQTTFLRYQHFILSQQQLTENLYPMYRLPLYKDYIKMVKAAPKQTRTADRILCLDCQMVSTNEGFELAKVSVMNLNFKCVYDSLVKPHNRIVNYNTQYSGITEELLRDVKTTLEDVQRDLRNIIFSDTILIGHSLESDLNALQIVHDRVIDTSVMYMSGSGRKLSLKNLVREYLKADIQINTHNSIQDTQYTLALAKFKIEIMSCLPDSQQQVELDVLEDIAAGCNKSLLIIDQDVTKYERYEVKTQKCEDIDLKGKAAILAKYIQLGDKMPKVTMTTLRYDNRHTWQQYYSHVDELLSKLNQTCPPKTFFIFNFEINKKVESNGMNIHPFSLFTTK